ncbi:hypothetical protein ScalyP_jg10121 [Parmales sp. scaly parma]|nr:hypothetical protein ScalyP_jg10121 [Parmales sp. scaly parma]
MTRFVRKIGITSAVQLSILRRQSFCKVMGRNQREQAEANGACKEWMRIFTAFLNDGARKATTGYQAKLNPQGSRFDKKGKTVEKYSDLTAIILAWGVHIQKHPTLVGLPSSIPDDDDEDQGVLLFWINKIHHWWMLEMSTSPLGDRAFAQCFEVIFMRWKGGRQTGGEETGGVKGGVFTQVELSSVHSILHYHWKISWAFEKEVLARFIEQGFGDDGESVSSRKCDLGWGYMYNR